MINKSLAVAAVAIALTIAPVGAQEAYKIGNSAGLTGYAATVDVIGSFAAGLVHGTSLGLHLFARSDVFAEEVIGLFRQRHLFLDVGFLLDDGLAQHGARFRGSGHLSG